MELVILNLELFYRRKARKSRKKIQYIIAMKKKLKIPFSTTLEYQFFSIQYMRKQPIHTYMYVVCSINLLSTLYNSIALFY